MIGSPVFSPARHKVSCVGVIKVVWQKKSTEQCNAKIVKYNEKNLFICRYKTGPDVKVT